LTLPLFHTAGKEEYSNLFFLWLFRVHDYFWGIVLFDLDHRVHYDISFNCYKMETKLLASEVKAKTTYLLKDKLQKIPSKGINGYAKLLCWYSILSIQMYQMIA
jgi:hypothetical protein